VEGRVPEDFYLASMPSWMKNYFTWHTQKRMFLHQRPEQWQSLQYYLVDWAERYPNCGGMACRGSLPYHLHYAAAAQWLLLFYHWSIPAPLESFLLPPQCGIDWTVPSWLQQHYLTICPFLP
jgi:hypothetical protein